jgi:hypothetical protein
LRPCDVGNEAGFDAVRAGSDRAGGRGRRGMMRDDIPQARSGSARARQTAARAGLGRPEGSDDCRSCAGETVGPPGRGYRDGASVARYARDCSCSPPRVGQRASWDCHIDHDAALGADAPWPASAGHWLPARSPVATARHRSRWEWTRGGRHPFRRRSSPSPCVAALHHPPPSPQHRGLDAQFARDLRQRPPAALRQGNRFTLELRCKFPPRLAHHTPSSSQRSVSEVSADATEDQQCLRRSVLFIRSSEIFYAALVSFK